jgi:hypothetical protein
MLEGRRQDPRIQMNDRQTMAGMIYELVDWSPVDLPVHTIAPKEILAGEAKSRHFLRQYISH